MNLHSRVRLTTWPLFFAALMVAGEGRWCQRLEETDLRSVRLRYSPAYGGMRCSPLCLLAIDH